jgi:MFS family permease
VVGWSVCSVRRLGTGPAIIATRAVYPMAWILVAAAPDVPAGATLLSVALVLHGLAMGVENANDTGYWQFVTPDRLLGRATATRRSANRSAGALGAVLGGIALTVFDERLTLVGVVAVFTVSRDRVPIASQDPAGNLTHGWRRMRGHVADGERWNAGGPLTWGFVRHQGLEPRTR